ncbi:hypothetical protein CY35_12G052800 [Sphagnum magellanicum]|nr:hypothetical protein CY35_12G052800 [Sphagnum magellanicum]KAH9545539.1 hypothetical protein CY35_12G052800 [Sphagnum magellanicum]KAH9545540.1 hypothetical protein CY35_12G052800 [Sphagnum magellanicum]
MTGNQITSMYLTLYNSAQSLGWALVLARVIHHGLQSRSLMGAYAAAGYLVRLLQLTAFLEVLHSALGLVHSSTLYNFLQWLGRSHVLFAIIAQIPEVQEQPPILITFSAWALSEVIRCPYYALTLMGMCPRWLTWLRYTAFIVLYPVGALYGEMLVMYQSLDPVKRRNVYSSIFKWLPFNYHSFIVVLMILYPCLWLVLYLHMFRQRQKKLSKKGVVNKRKTQRPKRID